MISCQNIYRNNIAQNISQLSLRFQSISNLISASLSGGNKRDFRSRPARITFLADSCKIAEQH